MSKQKSQLLRKLWYWIKITSLLLGLICGSVLVYQWWTRHQQLESLKSQLSQKEQENQQQYQKQRNYLELTANLAHSPNIQSFFTDLLRKYAKKFSRSKQIDISHYPLNFGGFYQGKQLEQRPLKNQYQKLGNCCFIPDKEAGSY